MKFTLKISLEKALGFKDGYNYLTVDFITSDHVIAFSSKDISTEVLKEVALDACWQLNEAGFFTFVNPEHEVIVITVECRSLSQQAITTYVYDHIYHKFI